MTDLERIKEIKEKKNIKTVHIAIFIQFIKLFEKSKIQQI